jgi:hypothetical protein
MTCLRFGVVILDCLTTPHFFFCLTWCGDFGFGGAFVAYLVNMSPCCMSGRGGERRRPEN